MDFDSIHELTLSLDTNAYADGDVLVDTGSILQIELGSFCETEWRKL